jgi:hypothetical protein
MAGREVTVKLNLQVDKAGLSRGLAGVGDAVKGAIPPLKLDTATAGSGVAKAPAGGFGFLGNLFPKGLGNLLGGALGGGGGGGAAAAGAGGAAATGGAAAGAGALGGLAAVAGPIGIAVAAAAQLGPMAKKLAEAPFKPITMGLNIISGGLRELAGGLGPVGLIFSAGSGLGAGIKSFGDGLGPLGAQLSAVGGFISNVSGTLGEMTGVLVGMAGKANPAALERFTMAVEDVQGVIGQRFVPVLNLMTEGVRFFGDILQSLLPTQTEMNAILRPLSNAWDDLKLSLKDAMNDLGPILKEGLVLGLEVLTTTIGGAVKAISWLVDAMEQVAAFSGLANVLPKTPFKEGSSFGAAAQPIKFGGLEDLSKNLIQSAYQVGVKPDQETANNTGKLVDQLGQVLNFLGGGKAGGVAGGVFGGATAGPAHIAAFLAGLGWPNPATQ